MREMTRSLSRLTLALLLISPPAFSEADGIDWVAAEKGILYNGDLVFSGCVRTDLRTNQSMKIAAMKARANIAKTRGLTVDGHESLAIAGKESTFSSVITETASANLRPIKIVFEEMVMVEHLSEYCVLVKEENP